ncbi:MAG: hypothetical protein U0414_41020 [Polyangiaceae bacterium]
MSALAACACAGASLVLGFALAPARALAQEETKLGWQLFIGGGARLGATQRSTNLALTSGRWSALPGAVGEGQGGFGVTIYDVTLDLHFQGSGYSLAGPGAREDALSVSSTAIGVELGYRGRAGRFVTLNPFVGIGTTDTSLCFFGVPSEDSDPTRPPFQQVLSNPGRGTCLESSDVALDLGVSALASVPFALGATARGERIMGHLGLGPRFVFTLPLTFTREWSATGRADAPIALPPFEGPVAPLGGAYVGVDVVFRGGLEDVPR